MRFEDFYALIHEMLDEEVVRKMFDMLDEEVKEIDVESPDFYQRVYSNLEKLMAQTEKDNM